VSKFSLEEIQLIHKNNAKNELIFNVVFIHSVIVKDISERIINRFNVDRDLIIIGAMLHDIGVYKCFDIHNKLIKPYITHGDEGYKILKKHKFPKKIQNFTIHHTGVGISKEEIEKNGLPLLKIDHKPQSLEEKSVCYADKFHSKTEGFLPYEKVQKNISDLGENKLKILNEFTEEFGIPDIKDIMLQYKDYGKKWNI
jgi:uncharacterized protein